MARTIVLFWADRTGTVYFRGTTNQAVTRCGRYNTVLTDGLNHCTPSWSAVFRRASNDVPQHHCTERHWLDTACNARGAGRVVTGLSLEPVRWRSARLVTTLNSPSRGVPILTVFFGPGYMLVIS